METSLREKAKAFGAVRRSYESISKHNQVRGPSWQGSNGPDPDNACTRPGQECSWLWGEALHPSWAAPSLSEESDAGERKDSDGELGTRVMGLCLLWQQGH